MKAATLVAAFEIYILKGNSMIRLAKITDVERMLEIYESAKHFMHTNGNPNQWNSGYPDREVLICDIKSNHLYVMQDDYGIIYACFALIGGEDPTYKVIDGKWHSDAPYGTIHRIAGDGSRRGVFSECTAFARTIYNHLRVDTHKDNLPMQKAVKRDGFEYAGIIYLADGSPRLAYDWFSAK